MRIMCKMTLNYLTPMAQRFLGENNMFWKDFGFKRKSWGKSINQKENVILRIVSEFNYGIMVTGKMKPS